MENAKSNKKGMLIVLLGLAWVLTIMGGCVVSLNIQKNNSNSNQSVDQNASADQENDSTNFNFRMR